MRTFILYACAVLLGVLGSLAWAAEQTIYLEVVCTQYKGQRVSQESAQVWLFGAPARYRMNGLRPLQLWVSAQVDGQGVMHVANKVRVPRGSVLKAQTPAVFHLKRGSDPPVFRFFLDDTRVDLKLADARVSRAESVPSPSDEPPSRACAKCAGSGVCSPCEGGGKIVCGNCFGTKQHPLCSGNGCNQCWPTPPMKGKCPSCEGRGYKMLCVMCGGSGRCHLCDGLGSCPQ